MPNHTSIQATHTAELAIPELPAFAKESHLFPHFASGSLCAIGPLCDAGCTAIFTKTRLYIIYKTKVILTGTRQASRLWTIDPLSTTHENNNTVSPHSINSAIDTPTLANRIKFMHASLFIPPFDTWRNAIQKGFLKTFPRITPEQLRKIKNTSEATVKGHIIYRKQNLRSTKTTYHSPNFLHNAVTPAPTTTKRDRDTYLACLPITGQVFPDQTGRFPISSASGNQYLFILYDFDSNHIFAVPIQNRTKHQLLLALQTIYGQLEKAGLKPKHQRMDNEISDLVSKYLHSKNVILQLTPAGDHRRNLAERAIQTFKHHFIAGLSSTNSNFPLNQWDKLVPQTVLTLNILRPSRIDPTISAHAQVHGDFNWN